MQEGFTSDGRDSVVSSYKAWGVSFWLSEKEVRKTLRN